MSDAFWFLLDHPDQRDLTKLDGNIQYVSPHFDRDVYEAARGVSFMNFEDAYDNWRLYGRRQGLEFAPSKNTILKIILKVKDEVDLIDKWIDHHAKIVGLHNIIIMDCGSTDRRFLDKLDAIRNEAVIFQYDKYYDSLHSYDSNKQFFELLKREARYICILDADEFLFGVSGDSISPLFVLDILQHSDLPCFCGTWLSNVKAPAEKAGEIDWDQPIEFGVDENHLLWNSNAGKALFHTRYIGEAQHIGHNIAEKSAARFATIDSFGKIGVLHIFNLSPRITKDRALRHLVSKGVISDGSGATPEIEQILRAKLNDSALSPIEKLYVSRCLDGNAKIMPHNKTFQTRIVGRATTERHEWVDIMRQFDFNKVLALRNTLG